MSLEELRKKIDDIDARIVRLIAERIKVAEDIGELKKKQGKQVEDLDREKIVLKHISDMAVEMGLTPEDIVNIYRQIIAASKNSEGMIWKE